MILTILFWVILVLSAIGILVPRDKYPNAWRLSSYTTLILFIIIGLRIFRTALG